MQAIFNNEAYTIYTYKNNNNIDTRLINEKQNILISSNKAQIEKEDTIHEL